MLKKKAIFFVVLILFCITFVTSAYSGINANIVDFEDSSYFKNLNISESKNSEFSYREKETPFYIKDAGTLGELKKVVLITDLSTGRIKEQTAYFLIELDIDMRSQLIREIKGMENLSAIVNFIAETTRNEIPEKVILDLLREFKQRLLQEKDWGDRKIQKKITNYWFKIQTGHEDGFRAVVIEISDYNWKEAFLNNWGLSLEREYTYEERIKNLQIEIKNHPDNPELYFNLGALLCPLEGLTYGPIGYEPHQDRAKEALPYLQKAVELAPHYYTFVSYLAEVYAGLGQPEECMSLLKKYIHKNQNHLYALYKLGHNSLLYKKYDDAAGAFKKVVIALKEKGALEDERWIFIWSCHELGVALRHLERYDEAIEAYQKAINEVTRLGRKIDSVMYNFELGEVYVLKGDYVSAQKQVEVLHSLHPTYGAELKANKLNLMIRSKQTKDVNSRQLPD